MQTQDKVMIQDEVSDTSNDDDAHKHSKHITIDFSDITSRYQDICPLGCGANALIFSAIDQQCQRRLAVKKVRSVVETFVLAGKCQYKFLRCLLSVQVFTIYRLHLSNVRLLLF